MRLLIALIALPCLFYLPPLASAPAQASNSTNTPLQRGWLDLQAGHSTMRQSEQLWQRHAGRLLSQRYGNALESFRNDSGREVSNLRVIVSELAGLEQLETARFFFFDGVLFRISGRYARHIGIDEAIRQLSQRYGQPSSVSGSERRQAYWDTGEVWVSLLADTQGALNLQIEHRPLARLVRTSNMEVYAGYVVAKPPGRSILMP